MGKNSRRKGKNNGFDAASPKDSVTEPQQALDMMVEDVHKVVNNDQLDRQALMEQVDQQLARFVQVIQNQRNSLDRLVAERQEYLGHRLVSSVMFDRMVEDKHGEGGAPHGELLIKMTESELTETKPDLYEMSIEDWQSDGRRYYCVRSNNPDVDPDPMGEND